MLAGVKFIPRDQINREQDESSKSISRKKKHCKKEKSSQYSSLDEEGLERIKKSRKKKWHSSEEYSSSGSSEASSEEDTKKHQDRKRKKKERDSGHKSRRIAKGKSRSNRKYQSFDDSTSSSNPEDLARDKRSHQKEGHQRTIGDDMRDEQNDSNDHFGQQEIVRREMGLEWMLRPESRAQKAQINDDSIQDETSKNEDHEMNVNPKELNPYLRNNGNGYPEDEEQLKSGADQPLSSSIVGDGGASWRLKALKRAQEQASREGRNLEEVVTERWGSLGQLAVNSASRAAAPSRAHLSAIKHRKKGLKGEEGVEQNQGNSDNEKNSRSYLRDVSTRNPEMRVPKVGESLSWKRQRGQSSSSRDAAVIYAAVSGLNKFANDGNFMQEALRQQRNDLEASAGSQSVHWGEVRLEEHENHESMPQVKTGLTANQLAAKALRLRMQGKHNEAEKIMQEVELIKSRQPAGDATEREWNAGSSSRIVSHDVSFNKKKDEDDSDMHLAQNILQNKQYSLSGRADDEYDFEGGPRKKSRKKGHENEQKVHMSAIAKRILTQQERCLFCFENPSRPKHLVLSIANFTYLMLPQRQPVVPGHCCILPMQHESATRTIDNNVWDEIRNFKKCLIMMFAKQDKELVFLETVMGLAQQRRHCLVECIPLPKDIAKEAPLYFKKAIDEAEDEWSQHNAKKLIDTSVKGLRASIPKDFPYFHVEFGLNKGFVHVIDDEKQFNSNLGFNVIRGMLQLPEEDMYRRRRYESVELQKQAVVSFARDWEPFDWTKQLD